ncbi:MAG TPA: hypothetical protein VM367_02995 [Pseudonocardia sp.]|nr:hypothetical protein [Pseudonocardia sp.]
MPDAAVDDLPDRVAQVAAAVLAHPAVARLDGGPFGTVASYLPGRRLVGIRLGSAGGPVEVAVVVRLGPPLPGLAAELAQAVRDVLGPVPVEVTFADVVPAATGPAGVVGGPGAG